jgi:hypothetical protein
MSVLYNSFRRFSGYEQAGFQNTLATTGDLMETGDDYKNILMMYMASL